MFKNYFKIAIRNLLKYKVYSLINILGLAIGFGCTILILSFIQNELSVDAYHQNRNQIVQAYLKGTRDGNTNYQSTVSPYIGPMLKTEYPEVLDVVRVYGLQEVAFQVQDKQILESNGIATDPNVFDLFTYRFITGDPRVALSEPHSMVISRSMAEKYFGSTDAIGKMIRVEDRYDFYVAGVIEDVPVNSYTTFDYLIPLNFLRELGLDIEGRPYFPCSYLTYARIRENTSLAQLNAKVSERMLSEGEEITFDIELKPFSEIYFFETGGKTRLAVMSLIALMILALACINFINLSTARHMVRAREVGIRKVAGATRRLITIQFMGESLLISLIAAGIGLLMARGFLPVFNQMMSRPTYIDFTNPLFLTGLFALVLITGILAGLYPAVFLSRLRPVAVMRRENQRKGKATLRKVLIVFQFVLSIAFILCTLIIDRQTTFLQNFNLGVNKQNVLYVPMEGEIRDHYRGVRTELLRLSNIVRVSTGSRLPTAILSGSYFEWGVRDNVGRRICTTFTDYDYLKTFDIQLAAGRYYSPDFPDDARNSIVVNEAAVRKVGLESPVGKPFPFDGQDYTLIGIVKDFHHNQMLSQPPEPVAFRLSPDANDFMFIKIDPGIADAAAISATVQDIEAICRQFSPKRPLRYEFYNDFSFDRERLQEVIRLMFTISTALAIFISCLGLFGLTSFMNQQKTKEVGIRKVLGASVRSILIVLTKDIAKWILLANVAAWPLAWFAMHKWLENFAYRVSLTIWPFLLSALIALIIALLTVSWLAIRAATANPVESLRYE
ncbi:ABC transporter permease [bacterium]|nr:ABC transporter permease [bacterium]